MLSNIDTKPATGISHNSKKWKDQLLSDPQNLTLMHELGKAYAEDQQWERAENVLLRGWTRVSELDSQKRLEYLMCLIQASLQREHFAQALAALNQIEEPVEEMRGLDVLKVQVHCANVDLSNGLKAFRKAIEGMDFETSCIVWAGCSTNLMKCGGWEVTKTLLHSLAQTEEDHQRLRMIENLIKMKDAYRQPKSAAGGRGVLWWVKFIVIMLFVAGLLWALYLLEQESLQRSKILVK